jgi:membrane-bound lytic murein transglycosylase B
LRNTLFSRLCLLILPLICAAAQPVRAFDTHRTDIKQFVAHMSAKYSFSRSKLRKLLAAAQSQTSIIDAMDKPAEKTKPWFEYRIAFLTERRVREGADFWLAHRDDLEHWSWLTGVPPEYLVSVLGMETYYGRITGRYKVLDALATLTFDYPARAKYFQEELEQFLLLTRAVGIDPLTATGSYAGAMGAPQFMPSNYRRYAVDADNDGHVDLWSSWPDIVASIGNYLEAHGWNADEPVLCNASADPDNAAPLDGRKLALSETVGSLTAIGLRFDCGLAPDSPAMLIAVDEADGVHWRIGYNNFYVITRYNHSALYAMAVAELAGAIKLRVAMNAAQLAGGTADNSAAGKTAADGAAGSTP